MRNLIHFAALLYALLPALLSAQTNTPWCQSTSSVSADIVRAAQGYVPGRGGTRYVKLKVIIASQTGPGGDASTPSIVQRDLDGMNELFALNNTGIQFELCGPVQVVDNDNLYAPWNFDPASINPYYEPGYITLVYCALLPNSLGGFTMGDLVYLRGSGSAQIAAHEVAHVLGLMHPHDAVFGAELVDGSNCATTGDLICDTPADPDLGLPGMVTYGTCSYIGTATDANGQAYAPITSNIMSYAPCVLSTFTPGQAQVMQYVLDNVKTNLRVSYQPIAITPFDTRQCHNVGSIQLAATPAPGSFDGPLVNGTTLVNAPNTPSEYAVTYTPTTPPLDSSTTIDQAFTMFDQYFSYNYTYTVLDSLVQTIRAGADGRLTQVDFLMHDSLPNNFRLRIYSGQGGGVLLHESMLSTPAIPDTSWLSFPVSDLVPMVNNAVYTLELVADHAFKQVTSFGAGWAYYDYMRGSSNAGGFKDAAFRTWVHALPPCQSTIRYYELYQVPPHYMLNLADVYCTSEADTVVLIGDNILSLDDEIWIEGVNTSAFVPAMLNEGAHELLYINSAFGCTDTTISIINVNQPAALSIPDLNGPVCFQSAPFVLEGDPLGGYVTIDGVRDSVLDPVTLGLGAHTANYYYEGVLDTVTFADQRTGLVSYVSGAQGTVAVGTPIWQSFTPAFGGRLEKFIVSLYGINGPFTYGVKLLKGTGTGGTVIDTDTITVPNNSYPDMLGDMHPVVIRDSVYTLQLERLPDTLSMADQMYFFTDGSLYTRGTGQFGTDTNIDLYFEETVSRIYSCADSIAVPFTVEVCTGLAEIGEDDLLLGPNPFTDVLTLRPRSSLRYTLYNAQGALVASGMARGGEATDIGTTALAAGLYTLRVTAMDGTGQRAFVLVRE
ncbi:MAG: hypothetical protein IPN85_03120 [Flavobacteriales bacterium]|nr:hypothetical protein [Flavobacteriales bacterium]